MLKVHRIEKIHGHPWVRAVVEVEWSGLILKGLKLEEHPQGWRLSPPGRKVAGGWQQIFRFLDARLEQQWLEELRGRLG